MEIALRWATPADAKRLVELYDAGFCADFVKHGECPGYGRSEESMLETLRQSDVY